LPGIKKNNAKEPTGGWSTGAIRNVSKERQELSSQLLRRMTVETVQVVLYRALTQKAMPQVESKSRIYQL